MRLTSFSFFLLLLMYTLSSFVCGYKIHSKFHKYTDQKKISNNSIKRSSKGRNNNSFDNDLVTVSTDCGLVEGKMYHELTDTKEQKSVYEFRNIPYALPPTGKRRWRPPVRLSEDKKKCWNGTLKYDSKNIIACPQFNPGEPFLKTDENCLVLTIRTPTLDPNAKLPVFYWIHGGGMVWGYNEMYAYYPDREFSASMNVVSVSINYRLSVLGFLSLEELWETGDKESYGNYGIMDQVKGLEWVRDNIQNFGGDPNQVTIYGESGGGTAIYCLLSSPLADGLYRKASPASGAPNIRVTHEEANKIYRPFLDKTKCNLMTESEIIDCLQDLDPVSLLLAWSGETLNYHENFPVNAPYKGHPVEILDPVVIPVSPDQISKGKLHNIDIMIGNTAQEIGPFPKKPSPVAGIKTWADLEHRLEPKVRTFNPNLYPMIVDLYRSRSDKKTSPENITPAYVYELMSSDVLLVCSTTDVTNHLKSTDSFNSVSRYIVSQPPTRDVGLGLTTAYHGWDTVALFGLKFFKGKTLPENDRRLMENLRKVYKDFMSSKQMYNNEVLEFWDNSILTWNHDYHQEECDVWRENGLLNFAWGNLG